MNWTALDPALLGVPFLAGLVILATHVPLGRRVLARGIIFLDLAVAQIAVLGVIVAHTLGWETRGWQTELAAAGAALAGAGFLAFCEARWPDIQEALIGSAFAVAASLAALLLANDPHGGEQLSALLAGQILWADSAQVTGIAALYALLLGAWWLAGERLGGFGFYLVFALAITASVQLIGVYLVFASLILPALATRRQSGTRALAAGIAVGGAAYAAGLAASALLDLPAGPAIVVALATASFLAARRQAVALGGTRP
jgi:zinc/manganese transport system permease protein